MRYFMLSVIFLPAVVALSQEPQPPARIPTTYAELRKAYQALQTENAALKVQIADLQKQLAEGKNPPALKTTDLDAIKAGTTLAEVQKITGEPPTLEGNTNDGGKAYSAEIYIANPVGSAGGPPLYTRYAYRLSVIDGKVTTVRYAKDPQPYDLKHDSKGNPVYMPAR